MADAVARAADVPAADVRRAAMLGGDLPRSPRPRWPAGRRRSAAFRLQVGRPVGPMLAQTATDVARRARRGSAARRCSRPSSTAPGCRSTATATRSRSSPARLDDVTARLPEVVDGRAGAAGRRRWSPTARRSRCARTADRSRSRSPRPASAAASTSTAARADAAAVGVRLRPAAPRRRRPARRAGASSAGRARPRSCRQRTRVDRLVTDDAAAAQAFLDRTLAAGHEGVMAKSLDRAVRGRPARRRLAEGQAGAHPRPGGARRRVGLGPAHRQAVQHPPRRPRPGRPAASSCSARRSRA